MTQGTIIDKDDEAIGMLQIEFGFIGQERDGIEKVHFETDFYDGPRAGIADYQGGGGGKMNLMLGKLPWIYTHAFHPIKSDTMKSLRFFMNG